MPSVTEITFQPARPSRQSTGQLRSFPYPPSCGALAELPNKQDRRFLIRSHSILTHLIIFQGFSLAQWYHGDTEGAKETQKRFFQGLSNAVDGIPVIGHVKGALHYAFKDEDGGDKAMMSATRSTLVMGAGVSGFALGGPVNAVIQGMGAGGTIDMVTSIAKSISSGDLYALPTPENVVKNVVNLKPGEIFDLAFTRVVDGYSGYSGGQAFNKLSARMSKF